MERQATCPVCKSTTDREHIIPLYGRGKTAKTHSMKNGQTIPDRPAGQRAESASGVGGTAAAQQAAQAGHFIQLADGFGGAGFLSTLFGSQIQFPANDRRDLTPEQMHLATLSRILLFMGSCIIFSLIML
jgi:hypothetical protein